MLPPESIVVVHLADPTEKLWGVLGGLDGAGIVITGINLSAIDTWMLEVASGEPPGLGLATMFVPMARVERVFLDEPVGAVESYSERFERTVGVPVREYLSRLNERAS